ncbi:hypothetical protein PFTANZ_06367, partial [Plasmodium falciparum Tanzania (2000708)]
MNSSDGSKCIKDCPNKCNCATEWIKLKTKEWKKIKGRYLEQYKNDYGDYYNVKTILEKFEHRPEFKNAIKPCKVLTAFKKSCGLNDAEISQKEGEERDLVVCLLENLRERATSCQSQHQNSEETQPSGVNSAQCEKSTPLEDDETFDDDIETEDVKAPNICPPQQPEEQTDDKCQAASPAQPAPDTKSEKREELPSAQKPPVKPTPAPAPAAPPAAPAQPTLPADEPFN